MRSHRAAELSLIERAGRALVATGQDRHVVESCRAHYRAVRANEPSTWSGKLCVEWLRVLRVPPYEHDYPILPLGSTLCPRCPPAAPERRTFTAMVFRGGASSECSVCGARWLILRE